MSSPSSREPSSQPARIVVGIDFSSHGERALDHGMAVARRTGASLTLAHVGRLPDVDEAELAADPSSGPYRAMLTLRLAEDRRRLAALRDQLSGQGVELSQVVVEDMPETGLARVAQELGAALLVVGTHGRTGAARLLVGSVAERAVRIASCSVLVARGAASAGGYHRIVVGTDLSGGVGPALEHALRVAAPGAAVRVIHAWSLTTLQAGDPAELVALAGRVDAERAEASSRHGRELAQARRSADVRLTFEPTEGGAVDVLVDAARDADLVVVGSHGRRGLRRFFAGSVAENVVRHAACSVLVAR
jgi:nucleotide-binding universal stress UspA family protein